MRVLSLCDYSGNMLKPWRDAGHECVAVDIAYTPEESGRTIDGIKRLKADVLWLRDRLEEGKPFDFIFAFPPCTDLAGSGARWFPAKGIKAFIDALKVVEACEYMCRQAKIGWMIENPVGRLNSWRRPDHKFDPCDYGDPYKKRTCLWTGGNFIMPPKNPVPATEGSKMHRLGPSKNRARLRSLTPMGFANAVFEANGKERQIS